MAPPVVVYSGTVAARFIRAARAELFCELRATTRRFVAARAMLFVGALLRGTTRRELLFVLCVVVVALRVLERRFTTLRLVFATLVAGVIDIFPFAVLFNVDG